MSVLNHLKTLRHVSIIIQIIFRELVGSLLKSLSLKMFISFFKNCGGCLWWCGSITFGVCVCVCVCVCWNSTPLHTESLIPGQKSSVNTRLLNPENVYFPPLHIELAHIKCLVLAMYQNSAGFMYLKSKFPKISDAKIWKMSFPR